MKDSKLIYKFMKDAFKQNNISIVYLQQNFDIGFNRASRIIYALEEKGIISKKNSDGKRDILISLDELNKIYKNGELDSLFD